MILSWDKPKKLRSTAEHNEMYQSDSGVAGTFVPNMAEADQLLWKAKLIRGEDPRVELRKTVYYAGVKSASHVHLLLIVRFHSVSMSMNGTAHFSNLDFTDMNYAVQDARAKLNTREKP